MSIRLPATGTRSVFRGMPSLAGLLTVTAVMLLFALFADQSRAADGVTAGAAATAPAATQAGQPSMPGAPPMPVEGAAMPPMAPAAPGAMPPEQAAMTFMPPPMPGFAPPRMMEPIAMAACRQCREGCFRDYGGPCADEACARALPLCMRNCWYAVCR